MPRKLLLTVNALMAIATGLLSFVTLAEEQERKAPVDRMLIVGSAEDIDQVSGAAQTIEDEDLQRHSYSDIHRALRQVPGINVLEEDGFGIFPNIGIRGTRLDRSSRITIMEDGVLAAPSPYSAPAAHRFPPISRIHRMEVRKGSATIRSGPYTTGGALNLISTPIPEETSAQARFAVGSYNSTRNHVWVGGNHDQIGWLLEATDSSSDGFKQLDTHLRTDHNMPRPNTGFNRKSYVGKLRWQTSESPIYQALELKVAAESLTANETYLGLTAEDYRSNPLRRYQGSQLDQMNYGYDLLQLRHVIEPKPGLDVTTTIYRANFARNWYKLHEVQNAPGEAYIGISQILENPNDHGLAMDWIRGLGGNDVLGNVRANNRRHYYQGIQTQIAYSLQGGNVSHDLEFGARYHEDAEDRLQWQDSFRMANGNMVLVRPGGESGSEELVQNGIPGNTDNRITEAKATALYLIDTIRVADLIISPGLRFEDINITRRDYPRGAEPNRETEQNKRSNNTQVLLPGIGLSYKLNPSLTLITGLHQGFAPTGDDKNIPEEKSWNYELGARLRHANLRAELIGFFTQYDNLVGTCRASTGGGCEVGEQFDGGKVDVFGLETMAVYDIGRTLDWSYSAPLRLAYTWTDSKFKDSFTSSFAEWGAIESGYKLPQIPEHQVNIGISLVSHSWSLNLNGNYLSETRAVAGRGKIAENQRIDSRLLLDLSGEFQIHEKGRIFASVENLTDERYVAAHRPAGMRSGSPRINWIGIKMDL